MVTFENTRWFWIMRKTRKAGMWQRLCLTRVTWDVHPVWAGILEAMEDFHRPGWRERAFQWSAGGEPTYLSDWADVFEGEIETAEKGCLPWPRSLNCTWTRSVGIGQTLGVVTPGTYLYSNAYHIILWYLSPCQTAYLLICSFRK